MGAPLHANYVYDSALKFSKCLIDFCSQIKIQAGYSTGRMCIQSNAHFVVYIAPLRMVIHLLGFKGYICHKGKCFSKISKFKISPDRTIAVGPAFEPGGQMVLDFKVGIYLQRLVQFVGCLLL